MLPDAICDEPQLDRILGEPGPKLVRFIPGVRSPLVILGAGGKMGLTVASMARRAADAAGHRLEVIAASRFGDPERRRPFEEQGIRTESVDLLAPETLRRLPEAADVISLVGLKFGTAQDPAMTWAVNTLAPVHGVHRYPEARWVALSTGNVYPQVPVAQGGATEEHPLTPVGEYANAAVARERLLEFASRSGRTRMAVLRLNYAVELRYGVLVDIALRIARGEPVDISNGWFNCIWQGDAADRILRSLDLAEHPPRAFNLCHGDLLSVRTVATELARLLDRPVSFTGQESGTALLSNPSRLDAHFGPPPTPLADVMRCTARWITAGGRVLNRPTRFEVRDGRY
ncbi:MAG: NAD-dependent epimerase/dehydratase family protein [Verrucomicrobia bacterium]|nr:NAD-dependent epimerase/dehydratase family protein [Verrucomicrobiota bacterium]